MKFNLIFRDGPLFLLLALDNEELSPLRSKVWISTLRARSLLGLLRLLPAHSVGVRIFLHCCALIDDDRLESARTVN